MFCSCTGFCCALQIAFWYWCSLRNTYQYCIRLEQQLVKIPIHDVLTLLTLPPRFKELMNIQLPGSLQNAQFLLLSTNLVWKGSQMGTNLLLIVTSTADNASDIDDWTTWNPTRKPRDKTHYSLCSSCCSIDFQDLSRSINSIFIETAYATSC